MATFLTLPSTIQIQDYASLVLIDPAAFRSDKGNQPPAFFLAVGNGVSEEVGIPLCDIYRIDFFTKQVTKITKTSLNFSLVNGLAYDYLADELLLVDGNTSSADKVFRINYKTGKIKGYTFYNYGLATSVEGVGKFKSPQEAGFLLLHSNPTRPLNRINFLNNSEVLFERRNLFYYSYYLEGSRYYQIGNKNDYSFLIFGQTPGFPNILMFKTVKSNLVSLGKASPMTNDPLDDKFVYRGIGNKIYTLDRVGLKVQRQTVLPIDNVLGLAIKNNTFYSIHKDTNQILSIPSSKPNILTHLETYLEKPRIKPTTATKVFAEVTDDKYDPLTNITVTARILVDKEADFVQTPCHLSPDGTIILQVIPQDLVIRDPFTTPIEPLVFHGIDYALIAEPGTDTTEATITDQMLAFEMVDILDNPLDNPLVVEGFFEAIPTGTIFDTANRSMSYWTPFNDQDPLTIEFSETQTVQYIKFLITKDNFSTLIIKDENNKIIYQTDSNLGTLQELTILDFIKTPEAQTKKLNIYAGFGTKIFDIEVKVSTLENLGKFDKQSTLTNKGIAEFTYTANTNSGIELIKISAHNKNLNTIQSSILLDDTLVKTNLSEILIETKETASSIVIGLKNPQISFSYSTMKLVEPPLPRPVDDLAGQIDFPGIPVLGNSNIIDSGSYITSITTSNNLIWALSRGGNASIISTNPLSENLDFIISPAQQPLGSKNSNITITARQNFTFTTGTQIDFGPGIVVNSIKILEDETGAKTKVIANINISDVTTIGPRNIQITSGSNKVPLLENRFEILPQAMAAVSPVNFVAESSITPRFRTLFINSASLASSVSWGPFIYIVDDKGYLTRSTNAFNIDKDKITTANLKKIKLATGDKLIVGTEQGAFYQISGVQDPLTFNPSLLYIASIPKILVDFEILQNKIIAINKGLRKLDLIDIDTYVKVTNPNIISTQDLENIWIKEDRLFVSDSDGVLFELDPTDFSTLNAISTIGTDKITGVEIILDNIYIATEQGKIYLYDGSLHLFQDVSQEGGIVTMSKYFDTLHMGTEYGRFISITVK